MEVVASTLVTNYIGYIRNTTALRSLIHRIIKKALPSTPDSVLLAIQRITDSN